MDVMQQIISGTQKETEELLREGRTATELTTLVTALKRELRNDKEKLSKTRTTLEELTNELRTCKDEKSLVVTALRQIKLAKFNHFF